MIAELIRDYDEHIKELDAVQRAILESADSGFTSEIVACALESCLEQIATNKERAMIQPILIRVIELVSEKNVDNTEAILLLLLLTKDKELRNKVIGLIRNEK